MDWMGLWQQTAGTSGFRCVYMLAWATLPRSLLVGIIAGMKPDGNQVVRYFYLRQDDIGDVRQLVLQDRAVVAGWPGEDDSVAAERAAASERAMSQLIAMHDAHHWEASRNLVLKGGAEPSLRQLSGGALAGETVVEPIMAHVIKAAGLAIDSPYPAGWADAGVLMCPGCAASNDPAARFCSRCGTELSVAGTAASATLLKPAGIPVEHAVTGLPVIPMAIEELSLDGPDKHGVHHFRAGIRISNNSDHGWARVDATATLFDHSGATLVSASASIDEGIPAGTDALIRPSWPRLAAAVLLHTPETFHVVVNAIAYAKRTYQVGECRLADHVATPVSLGRLTIPGAISCLSFEILKRGIDAFGNGFIDSRCVVQNLSPTTADYVEYVLELRDRRGGMERMSGMVSALKPGLIGALEERSWLADGVGTELSVKALLNVLFPVGYGCAQRRGEIVGTEEEVADSRADAVPPADAAPPSVERQESQHDLFPATSRSTSELRAIWASRWRDGVARFCQVARAQFDDKRGENDVPRNTFHFHPDIPPEKLAGALRAYPDIAPDDVRMLVDDTFFGKAKACLILTDYGIYAYTGAEPVGMELGEINSIEAGGALLGTMSTLRINDEDFFLSGHVSKKSMNTLAELLEAMRCSVLSGR